VGDFELLLCHGTVCVVGKIRDLILQLSKSSIYSTKPHCDHRGLPLALISTEGATAWCAEYDEWGNLLNEENP
ncbi:RHS domain-containing protein, partial [Escherichia coli]|uniref:RHS domain-containing protein n=1 Tax=Escherichia coli TaxID=562 RepID=UPI003F546DE3